MAKTLHHGDRGSNPGTNRLFVCPLDVLNILYCDQPVPCPLMIYNCVARLRVELGVCGGGEVFVCVCGSLVLVVDPALTVAISIKNEDLRIFNEVKKMHYEFELLSFKICTIDIIQPSCQQVRPCDDV